MGKLIKFILVFFSSVVLLIIAAAIIIPLVVDLNDYKTEIETAVEEQTGRALKIEGELHISVFPWLGFSTGKLSLSNASGFAEHPFAAIDEADIKVKLMPLFSKKVEISTVVLKGLALNLEKNKQGVSNWNDLTAEKEAADIPSEKELEQLKNSDKKIQLEAPAQEDDDTGIALAAIKIDGLAIENSQVTWNDQQGGQHIVVRDFNLSTNAIVFNEPIAINLSMLLENSEPAVTEQLSLSMNLVIDEALQKFQLHNFKLDSMTRGETIPGGILEAQLLSEIDLDLQAQTLALKGLQLKTDNLQLAGDINTTQLMLDPHYSGRLQIAPFSPKALMQQLAMDVPVTADKQVLQKLALSLDLQGTKDSVALKNLKITLDDTNINGSARVRQFNQPAITFQLTIDAIDVDRYSAPKQQASLVKTKTSATSTGRKASVAEAPLMPVDILRQLNLDGDLKIAKLKVAQLTMAGVSLNIQAQQGIVKTKQSIAQLYQGSYKGQITINAKDKTPRISLNEKISNVQLEPLVSDLQPDSKVKLKGQANITANLSGKGNTVTAIKAGLGGRLNFSINKGAIPGFNVQQLIDIGKLATKGKKMQQSYVNEQTLFSTIKGSAKVNKGIINNPDFLAESSTVEVKGRGTANLNNDALDYKVIAKIKKGGKNVANRPIAVNVQGTFSKPVYTVDLTAIESMMTEEEKQKVNKFIGKQEKKIDKVLGEGSGKAVNKLLKGFFN
ncbi:MAG TPA: AsmA family protein [Methyloprofundus sp.]|uniref:AsmA family protein n=1 Tax=Methyloprofundus sp. TaxID=2020875 RepID=UPI00185CB358|nr:AsmA family protein [Methyloprofundus sp.]HIG64436.1 AsmA family protein [Methyloprofundus sp.]HIL79215.1 AsmA family protein [Methylococcales bacterium]